MAILEGLLVLLANLIPQCHEIVAVGSTQYSKYSASKMETNLDYWLVALIILKNMKVNGKDYSIDYGKQKMFETINLD